ncbi:MAG TPA: GNAT family N-acetyltransferase [Acidimicrobiales bacterium]|nr:GNAT family N-acetyltransferase [Acidimicrobiales bacterium]
MGVTIRAARTDDIEMLQDIERRAGARFRDVGLADIADAEPFSAQELIEFIDAGRAWVAGDEPLGYAVATVVDGDGHLEQVSVDPEHQGAGLGRALVDRVCDWARTNGAHAVTLTTFTDVSWNRPLYEHLGFAVIPEGDIRPELRAVRDHEAELGLDPAQRVCMLRNLA